LAVLSHEGTYPILYGSWPIPVGTAHRDGYIARPDEAGRFPVVFVVPDINGLTSFEKDLCRRLARQGFAAITIDPYGGADDPLAAYNATSDRRSLTDLEEIHEFVLSEDVEWNLGDRVGLLGLDVGGRFALITAATKAWGAALVLAYTPLSGDEDREYQVADYLDHLPVPVLGLYGAADQLIDVTTVDEAQQRNSHGQWLLYEAAAHAFLDVDSDDYLEGAAEDAFARIVAFFSATLPGPEVEELG
jgi:carboxymethylenebutenolidase